MRKRQTPADKPAPSTRSAAEPSPVKGPPRRRWVRWVVTAGILACAGGALTALAMLPGRERKVESKPVPPVNVEIKAVTPLATLDETFRLPGLVEANRVVDVSAEVAGRIEKVTCREGRPCTAGEKLMTLNTDLLGAEYRRAKATAEFNQRELARLKAVRARGAATLTELDQARAQAEASQAAADLAKANLDRARIVAPASGVLNRVPVEEGEYLQAGHKVAEIVQNRQVKVVIDVPERYIQRVSLGDRHDVLVGPDKKLFDRGRVTYIAELADPVARTTRVELTVDNEGPGADLIVPNGLDAVRPGHAATAILVRTVWPGASAEAVAQSVTHPLAQALRRLRGATVRTGGDDELSLVSVGFANVPADRALAAVQAQVRRVPLPDGAPAPTAEVFTLATYWELARRGLRAGQIVQVNLKLRTLHDAVLVPLKAVIPLEKGKVVYVVKDGRAERRDVTLGFFREWDVLVLSGLAAGDKLIVKGQHLVGPGQRVKIVAGDDQPATHPASPSASRPVTQPAARGGTRP